MSQLVAPRGLWLPTPTWRRGQFRSLVKKLYKGPLGGLARNTGGGPIYDHLSVLEDCCCDLEPSCDMSGASAMGLTISGWTGFFDCEQLFHDAGGECDDEYLVRIEYDFSAVNGGYVTSDLVDCNGGPPTTSAVGFFSVGTHRDYSDPGIGPVVTTYGYPCDGGSWGERFTITEQYVFAISAGINCDLPPGQVCLSCGGGIVYNLSLQTFGFLFGPTPTYTSQTSINGPATSDLSSSCQSLSGPVVGGSVSGSSSGVNLNPVTCDTEPDPDETRYLLTNPSVSISIA